MEPTRADAKHYLEPLEHAKFILASAKRLHSLTKLNAPAFVIELERQLLFRRLILFPVDRAAQIACEEFRNETQDKEQAHLMSTGFFDEAVSDIDDLKNNAL